MDDCECKVVVCGGGDGTVTSFLTCIEVQTVAIVEVGGP